MPSSAGEDERGPLRLTEAPGGVLAHSVPGSCAEVQGEMSRDTWAGMEEDSTSW